MRRQSSYMLLHVGKRFKTIFLLQTVLEISILFLLDYNTKSGNVKGENMLHEMQKNLIKKNLNWYKCIKESI